MENLKKMDGIASVEVDRNLKRDYMKTAEKITDAAEGAAGTANKTLQSIQDYCKENPGKAIGIAVGVGAVVGIALVKALSRKESAGEKFISDLFSRGEKAWSQVVSGIEPALKNIKESVGV